MINLETESLSDYRPGGLHPVVLGDSMCDGRYHVIRKLGYGSFSTVWLARDLVDEDFVALKILMAETAIAERESFIMASLRTKDVKEDGARHILRLLDKFEIHGPNGTHQCLVIPTMGPSVSSLMIDVDGIKTSDCVNERQLPYIFVQSIALQVLSGLTYMHDLGIAHGDLQPGNVLCTLKDLKQQDIHRLEQLNVDGSIFQVSKGVPHVISNAHSRPKSESLEKKDQSQVGSDKSKHPLKPVPGMYRLRVKDLKGYPDERLQSFPTSKAFTQELSKYAILDPDIMQFKLSDFGNSFYFDNPPATPTVPITLRSPGLVVGDPITKSQDVWAYGCFIYELITGLTLFQVDSTVFALPRVRDPKRQVPDPDPLDTGPDDDHMLLFNDILGTIPKAIRDKWARSSIFFAEDGTVIKNAVGREDAYFDTTYIAPDPVRISLRKNRPLDMDEVELEEVADLLEGILKYDPDERPSFDDVAKHPWIQKIVARKT